MATSFRTAVHSVLSVPRFTFIASSSQSFQLARSIGEFDGCSCVGVDTETTGLDPHVNKVRLIQVASEKQALIVDLDAFRESDERQLDWEQEGLKELKELLEGSVPKVLQNAAFDLNFLRCEQVELGGKLFDTMIAAKIINNGTQWRNDLGSLAKRLLNYEMPKELQKADWSSDVSEEMLVYAARDAICLPYLASKLALILSESVVKEGVCLYDIFTLEMNCLRPIAYMQWRGFNYDTQAAEDLHEQLIEIAEAKKLDFLKCLDDSLRDRHPEDSSKWLPRDPDGSFNTRAKDSGHIRLGTKRYKGFNPASTQQMAKKFEEAGIRLPPTEKGTPSLDQNLLAYIRNQYALADMYLIWRKSNTRVSDIEKLLKAVGPDGRIHCNYKQMGTDTGRLSAEKPNLQQVNRTSDFRSKFIAAPGYVLVVADFSQVELRVAAHLSQEERMIMAYKNGRDLHTETASLMARVPLEEVTKEQRSSAKICNFGLLYGAGPATLAKQAIAQYGLELSPQESSQMVQDFRNAYPRLYSWQQQVGQATTTSSFTAIGRRRQLVGFNDRYTTRINSEVQGTAGDITKLALAMLWIALEQRPKGEAYLIATVHDEIVMEVKEEFAELYSSLLKSCMEDAGNTIITSVPIVADVAAGKTWADAK
ncbi:MAG: hypothetical protein EBV86_02155 [Marivivens sp.]|nr:hypothetical protein [Marivivens sp.]NCW67359.1 hypothetical protein [Marivivens sp.]